MLLIISGIIIVATILLLVFIASRYKKVQSEGEAIIINGRYDSQATLTGGFVWPIINNFSVVDITRKKISVVRVGSKDGNTEESDGLHCKDNIRADMKVDFYIGINPVPTDIVKVAKMFGSNKDGKGSGVNDIKVLEEHFTPKFSEALKTACKQTDFVDLFDKRLEFRERVKNVIKEDMDGFHVYDVVIDKLEQTSLDAHKENNILDSEGIRKIVEITSAKTIEKNNIEQETKTLLEEKKVKEEELRLQLSKTDEENKAKNLREIAIIKAQEKALTEEKESEYKTKSEAARIKQEEETEKREEQKKLEIQMQVLSNKQKEQEQEERINRAIELEKVESQKQVAISSAQKDLSVEEGKRNVAEIQSSRVEIERKIAKEEEETANLRATEKANRDKMIIETEASARAEASQIEKIAEAKANRQVALEDAERIKIESDANLVKQEKAAAGLKIESEAKQAAIAAEGLAKVQVEKEENEVIKSRGLIEAENIEAKGIAEAKAKREILEAAGSANEESRLYDKEILEINNSKEIEIERIKVEGNTRIQQSQSLAQSLANADIKLFGGEGINSIKDAVMNSSSLDARIDNSKLISKTAEPFVNGEANLANEILDVLKKSEISTGDLANVSVAQFLSNNPTILSKLTQAVSNSKNNENK